LKRKRHREVAFLRHGGRSVLLVEDSRMFSTAIRFRLESELGVRVVHCADMQSLCAVVAKQDVEFSLAIVDLNLPGAPDCEALDFLLTHNIRPLVFTGSFGDVTREKILAKGVLDYVVKDSPSAIQQVVVSVDRILASERTRALIVKPSQGCLEQEEGLLRRQRFEVIVAVDGTEALDVLDAERDIDLVLLDLDCPDFEGLLLLAEIHRRYTDMGIRVIGVSGRADDMTAPRFLKAGGDEFIRKPFCADEFTSRLLHLAAIQKRIQALSMAASRDYLTDVYNRRYFFETGKRLVDKTIRRGEKASIAILDIDHFKRLNDTYGHEVGDMVLKDVSRQLKARLGGRHLLARLGGEEFGMLFVDLDLAAAVACCDGLRKELAATPIEADGEPVTITVSIGVAAIEGEEAFDNHLNAADQFLYMAKHGGRNRVFSVLALEATLAARRAAAS